MALPGLLIRWAKHYNLISKSNVAITKVGNEPMSLDQAMQAAQLKANAGAEAGVFKRNGQFYVDGISTSRASLYYGSKIDDIYGLEPQTVAIFAKRGNKVQLTKTADGTASFDSVINFFVKAGLP
ncbi:MAG: hypothetical protein JW841_13650 [Deltaproteobacteria bacterium]|nr:hypothetical protein [Deltaproteobacteria bacterium]